MKAENMIIEVTVFYLRVELAVKFTVQLGCVQREKEISTLHWKIVLDSYRIFCCLVTLESVERSLCSVGRGTNRQAVVHASTGDLPAEL